MCFKETFYDSIDRSFELYNKDKEDKYTEKEYMSPLDKSNNVLNKIDNICKNTK